MNNSETKKYGYKIFIGKPKVVTETPYEKNELIILSLICYTSLFVTYLLDIEMLYIINIFFIFFILSKIYRKYTKVDTTETEEQISKNERYLNFLIFFLNISSIFILIMISDYDTVSSVNVFIIYILSVAIFWLKGYWFGKICSGRKFSKQPILMRILFIFNIIVSILSVCIFLMEHQFTPIKLASLIATIAGYGNIYYSGLSDKRKLCLNVISLFFIFAFFCIIGTGITDYYQNQPI